MSNFSNILHTAPNCPKNLIFLPKSLKLQKSLHAQILLCFHLIIVMRCSCIKFTKKKKNVYNTKNIKFFPSFSSHFRPSCLWKFYIILNRSTYMLNIKLKSYIFCSLWFLIYIRHGLLLWDVIFLIIHCISHSSSSYLDFFFVKYYKRCIK